MQRFDGILHDVAALRFVLVRLRRGFPGFAALNPGYIDLVWGEGLEDAVGRVFEAEAAAGGAILSGSSAELSWKEAAQTLVTPLCGVTPFAASRCEPTPTGRTRPVRS